MNISFLGTGAMGSGIAHNLLKAGHKLTVWNLHDASWNNVLELQKQGARVCEKLEDAASDADMIGISLTADAALKSVCAQILPFVRPGCILFDCSTVSPITSQEMAVSFAERQVYFLDTPVSGGMEGAEAGTLTVMVGGNQEAYERAKSVIGAFSSYFCYMGPSGAGEATKLINQLLAGVNQAVVCEAMTIAEYHGLNMELLYEVLVNSWGNSRMLERSVMKHIVPNHYESAARLQLMLKDLRLTLQMSQDMGCVAPITEVATGFYQRAFEQGLGTLDHSAIIQVMLKENKKQ